MRLRASHRENAAGRCLGFGARARSQAFTLIEVLVITAIIALLVAVLLPSLNRAREKSRTVKCQANLRSLVFAWHQYLDANGGRFPRDQTTSFGGKTGLYDWIGSKNGEPPSKILNRYLQLPPKTDRDAEVFACPSDRYAIDSKTGATCFAYYGTSYKTNVLLMGPDPLVSSPLDPCGKLVVSEVDNRLHDFNRNQISNEYRLALLGDFGWEDAWNIASTNRVEWHSQPAGSNARVGWHNVGFMDGHAEFTPIEKGQYVTSRYVLPPYKSLIQTAIKCQGN